MFRFRNKPAELANELLNSALYDQTSFYRTFKQDLRNCTQEAIIESPFITEKRMASLLPLFRTLTNRGVRIVVNTRSPVEHDEVYRPQAENVIAILQAMGVLVLYTGGHHRKLAILDRAILWEGSLNILSQNDSCEIMRRIQSVALAQQLVEFIRIEQHMNP